MSTRSRLDSVGLLLTLLVLVALAGVALPLAVQHEQRTTGVGTDLLVTSQTARAAGLRQAGRLTARALSYDGRHLDADTAVAKKVMTAAMQQQYDATLAKVRTRVIRDAVVHRARPVASSVISASRDQVDALVFLDAVTTARGAPGRQLDTNRVVVTLVRRNGTWLIAKLDAL